MNTKSWDERHDQLLCYLDWFEGFDLHNYASVQGAAAFCPSMLPKLWQDHPCPYTTPIYKEAWYRGFYSAACWFLIDRLAEIGKSYMQPNLNAMFEWYLRAHPESQWKRVPGKFNLEPTP